MKFFNALLLLGASAKAAATPIASPSLQALAYDDVIVIDEKRNVKVMKDYEYASHQSRARVANRAVLQNAVTSRKPKRDCEKSNEVQVLTDDTFLNWDVAMSPVVSALGGESTVTISAGYSIANSLSIGETVGASIESVLSTSFSISYSETWTTSTTTGINFAVPSGQYGIIVSEPSVRRLTGYYLTGCTDNWEKTSFTSDSYTTQTYGGMDWPLGIIRLCNNTQYPIPYCIGDGFHN